MTDTSSPKQPQKMEIFPMIGYKGWWYTVEFKKACVMEYNAVNPKIEEALFFGENKDFEIDPNQTELPI